MTQRSLIVIGASARAAAFSAMRDGWSVDAIDAFADADLVDRCGSQRDTDFPRGVESLIATLPNSPWLYLGGLENRPALVKRLAEERPLWGNSAATLRAVRDPWRLRDALAARRLRFPAIRSAPPARFEEPSLRKRVDSGGGLGVDWAGESMAAQDRQRDPPEKKPRRRIYYQRFQRGAPASALYVAHGGRAVFLGATRQLIGGVTLRVQQRPAARTNMPPFAYCGSVGPLPVRLRFERQLQRLGDVLAESFGLAGVFGVDVVIDRQRLWTIEVNPRITASAEVLERALGFNVVRLHVDACRDGRLSSRLVRPSPRGVFGKAIVYAQKDAIVSPTIFERAAIANRGRVWPVMADMPRVGEPILAYRPLASVFARDRSLRRVLRKLQRRTARLQCALT